MEDFETKYFKGQGPLFIGDRDASGNPTGLTFVGDLGSATLSPNNERGEVIENVTGSNAVGASWLNRVQYNISFAMRSIKPEHLAIALHGTNTAQAAGSVTDEAHTAYLDKFTPLLHTNVSSVVVTGSGGAPSYVEDTDYIVHGPEGMIEFISGGTITDATAVEIDYDYADQHHVKVDPNNLDKYLVFAGKNVANNGKMTRGQFYSVKLDPGVLDLISGNEASEMSISGTLQLDTNRPAGDQLFSWLVED